MNLSSISNYFTGHTASVLSGGLSTKTSGNSVSGGGQASPFAQLLSTLQQLEQSNPTQYQQATTQIATNLQSAAATATKSGNSAQATQLTTLSKDFTTASQSGQLPNVKDLAAAIGGGSHHLHAHASTSDSAGSVSSSASTPGTNSTLQQFLASLQAGTAQNQTTNPMSIIMSTLSSAGINS